LSCFQKTKDCHHTRLFESEELAEESENGVFHVPKFRRVGLFQQDTFPPTQHILRGQHWRDTIAVSGLHTQMFAEDKCPRNKFIRGGHTERAQRIIQQLERQQTVRDHTTGSACLHGDILASQFLVKILQEKVDSSVQLALCKILLRECPPVQYIAILFPVKKKGLNFTVGGFVRIYTWELIPCRDFPFTVLLCTNSAAVAQLPADT